MADSLTLCRAFLGRAHSCQAPASEKLEAALRTRWDEGRVAWPVIALPAETFAAHMGGCLVAEDNLDRFLANVRVDELYLTCACAQGMSAAIEALDRAFLQKVPHMLLRFNKSPTFGDEVVQILRERLLIGHPGDRPKIGQFSGQGGLLAWLRIAAVRTALNMGRGKQEQPMVDVAILADHLLTADRGPEVTYIKARYQPEFKRSLGIVFATLPAEQRNILRWNFLEGLSGERIACRLGVHRRTVVRRLAEARAALFDQTRRHMCDRLRLSNSEFDSMVGAICSDINLSISMFLQEEEDPEQK